MTIATYSYNGRGERVQKAVGGVSKTFVYDESGRLLGEYSATGFAEYLWLDGLLVGVSTNTGLHRIETDHLGAPRVAKGQYGNTTWRWAIEDNALGQKPAETIGDGDSPGLELNLRFPAQYFDQETGLHCNYFRDYDPATGRYIQSDPIGLRGGANLFQYAESNPLFFTDRFGLQSNPESFDHIYLPATTNCAFVIDCVKALDEVTPDVLDRIARTAALRKTGAGILIGLGHHALVLSLCATLNECKCNGSCPEAPAWPQPDDMRPPEECD